MEIKKEGILESEISVLNLFFLFWKNKVFITLLTLIFAVSSVFLALSLPPIFSSTIVLKSVQDNAPSLGSSLGVLSGLANVQGSLGLNPDEEAVLAMKHAGSKDFFKVLYQKEDFKKNLMAYKLYNPSNNENIYDEAIYNQETKQWLVDPLFLDAHKTFTTQHLSIIQEKVGGFVNITIEHQSPIIAAEWAELIYREINSYMKKITQEITIQAVNFLKLEMASTSSTELKKILASTLESKIQKLMYADISDDFIFSVVDSAYIPHERVRPSRAFICVMITFLGMFFSCLLVFILNIFNKKIHFSFPFILKIESNS
tara:strand:- start:469 stop:1413 length:945 start_codon:yes stop_codon:yes gene_type:complete